MNEELPDLNPTTRRFPRTLGEAFPWDAENTQWFYPPEDVYTLWDKCMVVLGGTIWVGLAYYFARN